MAVDTRTINPSRQRRTSQEERWIPWNYRDYWRARFCNRTICAFGFLLYPDTNPHAAGNNHNYYIETTHTASDKNASACPPPSLRNQFDSTNTKGTGHRLRANRRHGFWYVYVDPGEKYRRKLGLYGFRRWQGRMGGCFAFDD